MQHTLLQTCIKKFINSHLLEFMVELNWQHQEQFKTISKIGTSKLEIHRFVHLFFAAKKYIAAQPISETTCLANHETWTTPQILQGPTMMMIKTLRATQLFYACIFLLLHVDSLKCNCCTSNQYTVNSYYQCNSSLFNSTQHSFHDVVCQCFYYSTKLLFTLFELSYKSSQSKKEQRGLVSIPDDPYIKSCCWTCS